MAFHRGPKLITDGLVLYLDAANNKSFRGEPTTNTVSFPSAGANRYNNPGFSGGITNTGLTYKGSPIWEVTFIPQSESFISRLSSTDGFGFFHSMGTSLLPNTPYIASVYFKTDYPLANTATQGFDNTYSNIGGWGNSGTSTTRFGEDGWTRLWTRIVNNVTINDVNYTFHRDFTQNTVTVNTNVTTDIIVTMNLLANNTMTATTDINTSSAVSLANVETLVGFYGATPSVSSTTISGMSTGTATIINHGTETTNWTKLSTTNPLPKTSFPTQYYIKVRVPSTGGVNQTFVLRPTFNNYQTSITDNKYWKVTFNTSQLQVGDVIRTYWAAPMIEQRSIVFPSKFTIGTRGATVSTGGGWADISGNANHGELINNLEFNNANNGSIVFNGSDNSIVVADNSKLDLAENKTLCCWVYMGANSSGCGIAGKSNSTVGGMALGYGWNGNGFMALCWNSVNAPFIAKDLNRDILKWNYLAAVQDGNTRYLYVYDVEGLRSASYSGGTHTWNNTQSFTIGNANNGDSKAPANTRITNIKIYNRALTAEEVLQNYNATKSRFGL